MKRRFIYQLLVILLLTASCTPDKIRDRKSAAEQVKDLYSKDVQGFKKAVENFNALIESNAPEVEIQNAFLFARKEYKKIEYLTEYYNPYTAASINGPALDEVEEDDPLKKIVPPEGLQVLEEFLFPQYDKKSKSELQKEVKILLSSVGRLVKVTETTKFTDAHIFDAIRLQFVRIIALGISGFDSPIANHSIPEAYNSLKSIKETLTIYNDSLTNKSIDDALLFLQNNSDFNSFDRMKFIRDYLNPIARNTFQFRVAHSISVPEVLTAFSSGVPTIFDSAAFSPDYFAPDHDSKVTPNKIELGKILFFDPVLSGNNERSCASCHNPAKGFADGVDKSLAFNFQGKVTRNAPTILNAGLQSALFHDTRVMFLEDQASDVVANQNEMHGSLEEAVKEIGKSNEYMAKFKAAFPKNQQPLNAKNIKVALASYSRSLVSLNSKFDIHIRGEKEVLTPDQVKGFNLFMGKAKCGTCHFAPLFNGAVPPSFEKTEAEVIGVPQKNDTANATVDPDVGKFAVHQIEKHRFAFKTPTVRNVQLTAPYMHNGVFSSLEEVVDFYNRGGGKGIGIDLPNQTLPEDRLNLTPEEKQQIVAFMAALTDTTNVTSRPLALPVLNDKSKNRRVVGGRY